ncbi:uncharacterized protein V1518DRAFT_373380 [Limtongia smithiae]|uniref:uncharacterized protein n=1 Tax=Limtongia smithiae TaxID=1125753 RepID=UPI0034CF8D66
MAAAARYATTVLVAGMLITGCANSLLTKFQDNQCVANCDGPARTRRFFEQPVIQTFQMFIAEASCYAIVYARRGWHGYVLSRRGDVLESGEIDAVEIAADAATSESDGDAVTDELQISTDANMSLLATVPSADSATAVRPPQPLAGRRIYALALPAFCDICGTTLMNVGLFFTPVSIYQMTRGALVLFVGLFSVVFLHKQLALRQWAALGLVVLGVFIVGLSGVIYAPDVPTELSSMEEGGPVARSFLQIAFGVLLIALAQIFTATQFVYEEHLLAKYHLDSMLVVGYEGIFGFAITALIMIVSYIIVGRTDGGHGGFFDVPTGIAQIFTHGPVLVSSLAIMLCIGAFNFFGISVTKRVSATARSTIDTCRTLGIWVISIMIGWEHFRSLQLIGFALLVYGTLVFNGVMSPYILRRFDTGNIRL